VQEGGQSAPEGRVCGENFRPPDLKSTDGGLEKKSFSGEGVLDRDGLFSDLVNEQTRGVQQKGKCLLLRSPRQLTNGGELYDSR